MTAIVRQPKSADCAWSRHIKCLNPSTCGCTCHIPEALLRALDELQSGQGVEYESVEALWRDLETGDRPPTAQPKPQTGCPCAQCRHS